jgi:hypothetical protein
MSIALRWAEFVVPKNAQSADDRNTAYTTKCQREAEACLVAALSHFKAASGVAGSAPGLSSVVRLLDQALEECLTMSEGGNFGF